MKITIIQNIEIETPGIIIDLLGKAGIDALLIKPYAGEPIPKRLDESSGLIVMGGPMAAYETTEFPFIQDEIDLIKHSLNKEMPILGICLGCQLLAAALGARVYKGQEEIGWHEVRLTEETGLDPLWQGIPKTFTAFHWHGDIFELPKSAKRLASSRLTENQAFQYRHNTIGILFHAEITPEIVSALMDEFPDTSLKQVKAGRKCKPESMRIWPG